MNDILERLQGAVGDAYRIERELARGGMSQLFLATESSLNRPVVIKILPPEEASAVSAARFRQEIEVAATLQHPHILPVLSTGNKDDLIWFIMPYVRGESLRQMLDKAGPLPVEQAVDILTEVADALAFAHQRGVIHRDIKPENILIHEGHAVLTDFGVARAREQAAMAQNTRLTGLGMAIGTPGYMSPEQAAGETNIDARSDLYALAVVGYEMLTGQPPFTGPTAQSVMAAHLTATPKPITAFRKDVPSAIVASLNKALAKSPDARFQTGAEFCAALRGATRVRSAGPSRRMMAAVGVVLAVAVVFGVWPRGYRPDGDPRQSLVIFPFENRTGDASREYLEEAAMNLLGLSAAHWQDMRVFDDERTASALRRRDIATPGDLDFEQAQSIAQDARVGTLVLGDLRREGDSLTIEAKVHDVRTGDRLATHIVRGAWTADPRPLFDALAGLVLGTSGAPPGERPSVLAQTTTSVEAYRAYLAGTQALQRFAIDSAKAALNRAIALDSSFALAYMRLRDAEGWTVGGIVGNPERRRELIALAQRHAGDLPPRIRSLLAFHAAYESGDYRRARGIAGELIARDSTDVEAWYQLGEAHFHHGSNAFPPPDTVGNIGRALRAFQRSLALDSNYVLAYQHILDALRACAGTSNGVVCLADSAQYGADTALARRVGTAAVAQWKEAARGEQIRTARGWVAIAPTSDRAHVALISALAQQNAWADAEQAVETFRRAGGGPDADFWYAVLNFQQHRIPEAVQSLSRAFAAGDTTALMTAGGQTGGIQAVPGVLAGGGGMLRGAEAVLRRYLSIIPVDSVPGPANLRWSVPELTEFLVGYARTEAGAAGAAASGALLSAAIDRRTTADSAARRRIYTNLGSALLGATLASGDTTSLSRFMRWTDTTASATWRVAATQLALARGDTALARRRARQFLEPSDTAEWEGEAGVVRAYAWGDVLARLGEHRRAIEAYEAIDRAGDIPRLNHPGYEVRSWLERGALYQEVGQPDSARAMYQRFVDAWGDADPEFQPLVDRARDAIRALEGQTRRPGG